MPTLHWLTRDHDISAATRVPYRLLEELPDLGYGVRDSGNMLIQGDNLDALKALLPFYAGKVKCIFIDPPYNTRSAFEHYDDNLEHSQWLSLMWPRLELLRDLLSESGSIWVSIDDNEGHYLKVIMDEIFGRANFIANVLWQKVFSPKNTAKHFSEDHDHILVYGRNGETWRPNNMPRSERMNASYKNVDNDARGPWTSGDLSARNFYGAGTYPITCPSGRVVPGPPNGMYWRVSKEKFLEMDRDRRIWWGADGNNTPRIKRFLKEVKQGVVPQTMWMNSEVGNTQEAKKEVVELFGAENFMTPKPERLMERILHIATNSGDLVLDSFLGSGTTAAVAHKMGRNYLGIEMGEHAVTHCAPRLRKVIDGEQGGISANIGWQGGGGFRFYRLGEPAFDADGRIHDGIRFPILAAHVWFSETGTSWNGKGKSPLLGFHGEHAYALLYNGILGDKTPKGGNVLTRETLRIIREKISGKKASFNGRLTIYGEATSLSEATQRRENIAFRQTPYDVKARK